MRKRGFLAGTEEITERTRETEQTGMIEAVIGLDRLHLIGRLPENRGGRSTRCEGALNVDEALVVAATETEGDIALRLNEGAVDEDIEFLHDRQQLGVFLYFFPGVTGEAPDVVTQLLLDAMDEGTRAVGLLQRVASAQGDGRLIIGDHLHQLVEGAFFPTPRIPRGRVVATRATMIAARQVD